MTRRRAWAHAAALIVGLVLLATAPTVPNGQTLVGFLLTTPTMLALVRWGAGDGPTT